MYHQKSLNVQINAVISTQSSQAEDLKESDVTVYWQTKKLQFL